MNNRMEQELTGRIAILREYERGRRLKLAPVLKIFREEIQEIIRLKTRDVSRMEVILDSLLELHLERVGQQEFLELILYYRSIQIEKASVYIDRYREREFLFEDEFAVFQMS